MRKTIDLTDSDIKLVEEFQKANQIKNFSEAVRVIIRQSIHIAPKGAGEV